eukprot:TRINITY_DN171_c2_g3_i1.p1 TRINITY_DN171_c2_g3~~TRINITY_DN171_c2_g3_i1.p1  ORF type:complete len:323 (+),score=45.79 TRINITY_DN171_c2_g3_i1:142-969(+)
MAIACDQALPPFQFPPEMMRFRDGVNLQAIGDEKVVVTKQFWKEYNSAMHTGKVADFYEAWLDDEVVWTSSRLPLGLKSKGKLGACRNYNIVVDKILGGTKSTVSTRVNNVTYHPKTDVVRLDFTSSVMRPGAIVPTVEYRRFTIRFNNQMKIAQVVVSPCDDFLICPVRTLSSDDEDDDGCDSEKNASASVPLQPPTMTRPCLHNNWDPVRVKRRHALLRCRVCASQWKIPVAKVSRCPKYHVTGCAKGEECGSLHINVRKQTYTQRTGLKCIC